MNSAKFGPAGTCERFKNEGHKTVLDIPSFLQEMGLDCFEYQCGRGVNVTPEKAAALGELAKEHHITLSLHAPYYISLASVEEEKRDNSVHYILQSARAVDWMGGDRIVVHPGGLGGRSREEATAIACETLRRAVEALEENHLSHVHICPETMGKINQLGTLEEVLAMCLVDESMLPCIDFGHLNARTHGGLCTEEQFAKVLDAVENRLGHDRACRFHAHFSKIEYTEGGEKRHLTFEDTVYGPDFAPLGHLLCQRDLAPTVICESAGTQSQDALTMKTLYRSCLS